MWLLLVLGILKVNLISHIHSSPYLEKKMPIDINFPNWHSFVVRLHIFNAAVNWIASYSL